MLGRKRNLILDVDAYKLGHWMMQKPGYEGLQSYLEGRVGGKHSELDVMGLSYAASKLVCPTNNDLAEAVEMSIEIFGYNMINVKVWEKVVKLGYLPVKLRGIPEGTRVYLGTPLYILQETEPWFAPVCNGLETLLLRNVWYQTTLLTRLNNIKKKVNGYYLESGTLALAQYAINDFSARSATSDETSDIAGMVHLIINKGSDNIHGQLLLNSVFGKNPRIASVWATEHSVALSYGPGEGEYTYAAAQLTTNTAFLKSIVSDTYDYKNFVSKVLMRPDIKELLDAHIGRVVIRPDSGDMFDNVLWTLMFLDTIYGSKVNSKGYMVLNCNIGVIQGDGMNEDTICELYEYIASKGWSADNMVVGAGTGIMYEGLTRDTDRFAMKPSVNTINGEEVITMKNPKTDPTKASKGGRLKVDSNLITHSSINYSKQAFDAVKCIMEVYYENGNVTVSDFRLMQQRLGV